MDARELEKRQATVWTAIDRRFSELVKERGKIVYSGIEYAKEPVYDGCLDVEKYTDAPIHVMWILKEHNDAPIERLDNGHLALFVDCLTKPVTFKKMCRNIDH